MLLHLHQLLDHRHKVMSKGCQLNVFYWMTFDDGIQADQLYSYHSNIYIYICANPFIYAIYVKKTYQFTTVCKDDVMISVF